MKIYTLNTNQEKSTKSENNNGESKLCRAIIMQALSDITKPQINVYRKRCKDMAERWIMSNERKPFSFLWCCEYGFYNSDTDAVASLIRKSIKGQENGGFWHRLLRRSSLRRACD